MDTGPPRREDEAEQIESSRKDARCLLEPDPRGARKRGKGQDIRGYHNTGEDDLIALTIENERPKKEPKRKGGGNSGNEDIALKAKLEVLDLGKRIAMLRCIGDLQRVPAEEIDESTVQKYLLCVDDHILQSGELRGKVESVIISNRDKSNKERAIHKITISGEKGKMSRAIRALIDAFEKIDSAKTNLAVPPGGEFSKVDDPQEKGLEMPLPEFDLNVRWSELLYQDIIFIEQGVEKVSVSKDNISEFIKELKEIFGEL